MPLVVRDHFDLRVVFIRGNDELLSVGKSCPAFSVCEFGGDFNLLANDVLPVPPTVANLDTTPFVPSGSSAIQFVLDIFTLPS